MNLEQLLWLCLMTRHCQAKPGYFTPFPAVDVERVKT